MVFTEIHLKFRLNFGKVAESARFVLDVHLGKLARLLRMTGFDTIYRNNLDDNEIIGIAMEEERIVLTRDRCILKNKKVKKGYFVQSRFAKEQLHEVIAHFGLQKEIEFLSRCIACNGTIVEATREEVETSLQPCTLKHFTEFFRCRDCGKVYWEGSHYDRMMGFYEEMRKDYKI